MSLSFDGCRRSDCWICLWIYVYYIILIPHPAVCRSCIWSLSCPTHLSRRVILEQSMGAVGTEKEQSCRAGPPAYVACESVRQPYFYILAPLDCSKIPALHARWWLLPLELGLFIPAKNCSSPVQELDLLYSCVAKNRSPVLCREGFIFLPCNN